MPSINALTNKTDQLSNQLAQLEGQVRNLDVLVRLAPQVAETTAAINVTSTAFSTQAGGPTVTVNIGPSGRALVSLYSRIGTQSTAASQSAFMSFNVTGASTVLAGATQQIGIGFGTGASFPKIRVSCSGVFLVTGLSTGINTVTASYMTTLAGSTGQFFNRAIVVQPLS